MPLASFIMGLMRRSVTARILRVNHGGEHGAIRIYRAQMALANWRYPDLTAFLAETLGHETEHLATFRGLMPARESRPCRMMWLWGAGGSVLGLLTGLLGRRAVLVCTEAVERTVHHHLEDQLRYLDGRDGELAGAIRAIQVQELGHLGYAVENRGPKGAFSSALDAAISGLTETLIWLSTQGDSVRLARELRA